MIAFASTNIDDAFVLVAFLANRRLRAREVVIGQYFGMSADFWMNLQSGYELDLARQYLP